MKPFLYLDNWHEPQSETRFDRFLRATGLPLEKVRTNHARQPRHFDYCGVYVSPSFDAAYDSHSWVIEQHELLRGMADRQVPMLGLCFGSQILASALLDRGMVKARDSREAGWGHISLTPAAGDDPLARDLPTTFPVFHWHGDEVLARHPDIFVIAGSDDCPNQIWRWAHGPVWGVQPHLEMCEDGVVAWFKDNRAVFENAGMTRSGLAPGASHSNIGFEFLKNFAKFVMNRLRS